MIIGVQGSKNFSDYAIFMRAMGTALSSMKEGDSSIAIFSAGPHKVNSMVSEFVNISERGVKARGMSIKMVRFAPSWIRSNMSSIDHFIYLSLPKEPLSDLVREAEDKDIFVGVYRY
jgi:hypothetical protein